MFTMHLCTDVSAGRQYTFNTIFPRTRGHVDGVLLLLRLPTACFGAQRGAVLFEKRYSTESGPDSAGRAVGAGGAPIRDGSRPGKCTTRRRPSRASLTAGECANTIRNGHAHTTRTWTTTTTTLIYLPVSGVEESVVRPRIASVQ